RSASRRRARGRSNRTSSGRETQPEVVESFDGLVERGVEDARDRAQIIAADREHASVEVLALYLDHLQVAHEHLCGRRLEVAQPAQVDGDARPQVAGRRFGEVEHVASGLALFAWQELIDRYGIEPRQPLQPRNGDGSLAALVG